MGSTTYASIPYPDLPASPNVPADVQALATRVDTILSLALGGGSTIPGGALSLSTVPSQITTLTNTQNSQATTLNALNTRPYVQEAYNTPHTSGQQIQSTQSSDTTIQTLSVPTATYMRLMIVYMSSLWAWTNNTTTNSLRSKLRVNGTDRIEVVQAGPSVTLSAFHFETVAPGAATTLTQTIGCYNANQSSTAQTRDMSPIIYALLLPWFNSAITPSGM